MKNKNIEKKIKRIMFEKDINQSDLAKKLGITRAVVSNWFTGKGNPNIETLTKIAKALNVPASYFFENSQDISDTNDVSINTNSKIELMEEKLKRHDAEIDLLKKEIEFLKTK